MKRICLLAGLSLLGSAMLPSSVFCQIHAFKGGVRIPAGSCVAYAETDGARITSVNGGMRISSPNGPVTVRSVCQLPVPEKAKIRQFVVVGDVTKGEIFAYIGAVPWNQPRQVPFYANVSLLPSTPYEVPAQRQKKAVRNVPLSGSESLTIDRINTYFIDAEFKSNLPISAKDGFELFYFEVYWD